MANTNYELYLKQLQEQYKNTGLEDIELDAQISKRASLIDAINKRRAIESNSIITSNAVNNGRKSLSQIAQENKIAWSSEYEAESLNWWEQVGAWVNSAKNTVAEAFLKLGEGVVDAGALVGSLFAKNVLGDENASKHIDSFIKQDLTNDLVLGQEWYRQADKYLSGTWMFGDRASKYSYNDKATQDWVKNIAQGVGSSLGFAALTSIPYVGWGLAAQGVGGQSAEEALNEGATSEKAFLYGLGNAAVESITELTVGKILNLIGKGGGKVLTKLTGKQVSGQVANDVVGGIGKSYGKSIALNLIKNFNEEGMEEVVSDIVNPILKMIYKESDKNNFFDKYQELFDEQGGWQGLFESYLYGGLSAGMMEGVQVGGKVVKYQSVKAVQFENSMNEVVELNAQLKEEIEKNDVTKYPNLEDNPKIKKILQQKQFIQEKIANDFKEWLDTVKNNYDELVQAGVKDVDMPRALRRKVGLAVGGEMAMNENANSIMQDVGRETVKNLGYEYEKAPKNATDFKNKTVYVNGRQTFNEYFKTILHESEHIASAEKGSLKESKLTSSIIESMTKDVYNEEFKKQVRLQAKNFVNTAEGKKWLKNNGLTLAAYEKLSQEQKNKINEKMGAENKAWFNEEVAAEHLMDSFTSFKDFNKIIKKANSRGLRKMLNAIQKAFSNNKNKPEGYDKIVKTLQDGIKDSRTNENTENRYRESKQVLQKQNKSDIIEDTKGKEDIDNDFRRLQETSRELLKRFENSTRTNQELDEGVRERYTRSIREKLAANRNSDANVSKYALKSVSKGTTFNIYSNVDTNLFHDAFETIKPYLVQNELVDLHDNYDGCKCYLSEDGLQGFAIEPDGNLISAFNADVNKRGYIEAIKDFVIEQGGTHLDCYGYLAKYYEKALGFKVASLMDYNMEYDHHNIAQRFNEPKIAFMVNNQSVETKTFDKDSYDAAKQWQLDNINNDTRFIETEDSDGDSIPPQMAKWNEGNKFVDDEGRILKLYHGSEIAGFMEFRDDNPIFLTPSYDNAYAYGGNYNLVNTNTYKNADELIEDFYSEHSENDFYEDLVKISDDAEAQEYVKAKIEAFKNYEAKNGEDGFVKNRIAWLENALKEGYLATNEDFDNNTVYGNEEELLREFQIDNQYNKNLDNMDEELDIDEGKGNRIYSLYAKSTNPLIIDCHGNNFLNIRYKGERLSTDEIAKKVKEEGKYDGIIFKNIMDNGQLDFTNDLGLSDVYVVFKANQVKATTNENPTASPDIRFREVDSEGNELSEQQQKFFADSKIRDDKGNLLVVYHGTQSQFNVYDKKKLGKTTMADDAKLGFHLTDNKDLADIFSKLYSDELIYKITDEVMEELGVDDVNEIERRLALFAEKNGNVKKQYLNVKKPLDITIGGITSDYDIGYAINYALEGKKELNTEYDAIESYEDIANILLSDFDGEMTTLKDQLAKTKGALDRLKELGYDGLILPITRTDSATLVNEYERGNKKINLSGKEYIVFESNQIKNVDNLNPTESDDIRFREVETVNEFDLDNEENSREYERYSLNAEIPVKINNILDNAVNEDEETTTAKLRTAFKELIQNNINKELDDIRKLVASENPDKKKAADLKYNFINDVRTIIANIDNVADYSEKFASSLNKAQTQAINEYNRYAKKLDKIIGKTKATQVANTNVSEATAEAQEEYVFNREVVKKALKDAGVDVNAIYNQASRFSQSQDILALYKQIKETPNPTRQSTIEKRYNDLVKPYDDLVNAYAEYLQRTNLDAEKQGQALEFFKDDLFAGSYKRRFNEPKIDKTRELYNNNFGRTGREVANDIISQLQPQTEPQVVVQERVRIINNARKVATPEMAGIKAQADLRLNGKVYTLNSVNNQIKFIEKTLQESGITRSKNFKIDFEGTTREIKAVEIAMILNEYNNTQYVRNEDAINYSNLTAEQKAEKITDIIAEGLTFDSNPADNITNDRLSDFVAVGDRFATTIKEFVRSEIETLIANEGKVSKIKKILEGQTRVFRERIAALQTRVSALSQKVVSLKAELENARGNERKVARLQRQLDSLKEQLSTQRKETRKYKKELTQALKQVATLENKNARLEENINYYKQKNIELYTDAHGIKKIKVEDIKTLLELGKNINPDFKLSSYVLNQISNALSNNKIDVAVDYYMNALMNSDYVDGDTLIPFSELVVMQEAIFGDEYIENGENRDVFAQDMEEIRKGLTSIFEGASISTKGKFLERISKLWVYNEQIKEKLRAMRGGFKQYKRAVLVTRTAQNFYNKIKSDIDGATKSGIRTGGVNPDLVKAMRDFYKITNKLKAEKVLNGELLQPLMELRNAWNLAYMKNQTSDTPVNTYFSSEESNPFKVLNDYIDTLINTDETDRNVGYYSIYQKVLNGIKRMFEIEIKLRHIKMGKYDISLADLARIAQDENWKKPDEKLESFSFTQSFLTPLAVIEKMAQYDENRVIYQVYQELFESEKRKESAELDLRSTFNDFEKNKDSKAFKKSLKKTYELNGIKAKKGQFLSLYEMFKREQARQHIENRFGGIEIDGVVNQFRDENGNVDTAKLEGLIKAIEKEFNLQDANSIDSQFLNAVENFFKKARRYKKDVDMQRWGFSNVSDDFYFPIAIAESDRQQNISSDNFFNTQMPGTAAYTFNETTTGTMGAIKLNDIIDVVMNHLSQMSNYAGYGVVADNVKKLWNYKLEGGKTFAQALKSRYDNVSGVKLQRFIATLMNDVQGIGGKQASNVDNIFYKIINKIRGNVATVALGANPKVMFSQVASIPAAMKYIKGRYLAQALKSGFGVGIGNGKLPPKPDMFTYRQQTKQVAQAETQGALAYVGEALEGVKSTLSRGINAFDTYAINVIWKASLLQTRNADGSWNIEEATKLAEKTVFNTQPNYIALGRSEFLRSRNDLVRLFTMFQSQAQQNLSMAYSAIEKIAYKKKHGIPITRGDWDDLAKALVALLIQGIVYTGMGELFKHIVNNDWKDINASKEGVNFGVDYFNDNIMGMIPILNNIELDLKQKWKVNFSNLRAGFLDNVTNIFQNMDGKITGKEINTDLSYITGLPGTNIYKWTKALAQYIPGASDYVVAFDTSIYQGKEITKSTVKNASTSNLSKTYYRIFTNRYVNLSKDTMNTLYSLYSKGYTDVIVKAAPETYSVNGETRKINYNEFSKYYGNVGGVLDEITKSSQFGGLNEEMQAKVITKVINTYYNASKKAQSGESMNLLEKLAYLNKSIDPKTLAAIIGASEIEGDEKTSKKTKITKYINSLRMNKSNKYFVYTALGYKVDSMLYKTYLKSTLRLTNREIKQLGI